MSYVYLLLLVAGMGFIQWFIGGTRLLFSLPAYGIIAVASVLTVFSIRRIRCRPALWCLVSTALLFSYILVRCRYSPIEYLTRNDFFTVLGCLMVYLLAGFYLTGSRQRMIFIFFLILVALVNVGVGVIQFTRGNDYMVQGFIRSANGVRASGLFISPNHYAGYLEAVAVMALSLAWWSRLKLWVKLLLLYTSLCCYFGVAISGSRGGYFSSLSSMIFFAGISLNAVRFIDRQKFVRMTVIVSIIGMVAVGGGAFLMLHSDYLKKRMNMMVSRDVRLYNWQASMDQFRVEPWLGTGSGTHLYYGRQFRRPQIQTDPVHCHSDYLELLCEYGIAGAAGMLIFILCHLKSGYSGYSNLLHNRLINSYLPRSDTFALNVGGLSAVAGLAVHSVVDFNMHIPGNALLFAFIFGMIASPGLEENSPGWKIAGWFRFALPPLAAWFMVVGIPKIPTEYFTELSRVGLRDKQFGVCIGNANLVLGEVDPEAVWPETSIRFFGGEKNNPNIYFYIGEANRLIAYGYSNPILRRNQFGLALDAYKKGLEIFPQDEHMLVRMAQVLDGLKLYDEAEAAYVKAIGMDPNLGVIYGYYGAHLKLMGRTDESKAAYDKGQKLASESIQQLGQAELGL